MAQGRSTKIKWIRTSRLSIKNFVSCRGQQVSQVTQESHGLACTIDVQRSDGSRAKVDIRLHGKGNSNAHGARLYN